MKKNLTSILCVVLALCTLLCTGAMAAELPNSGPTVRVNGQVISFPDGQPFIDNNGRTMIPVRFVTEQLGATVTWDGKTQTANIAKNGIKVAITIGNADMKVTKNSKTDTVKMDTAAVLKDGRTYVPIRFVAEALGAVVDYSEVYQTVGIYADKLTAEQIAMLRELPYTTSTAASGYEAAKARKDAEGLKFFYGTDRDSFKNFANAREHLYAYTQCKFLDYDFAKLNYPLPDNITERLKQTDLNDVPFGVVADVICFCLANQQDDSEWVVLPVGNFDAYYGNTYFSRKWLSRIPNTILERSPQKSGICRVRLV